MSTELILERLMREYGDSVFRMCFLYLKDYHLAEDATQGTFMKAMKNLKIILSCILNNQIVKYEQKVR